MKSLTAICVFCFAWTQLGCNDEAGKAYLDTQHTSCLDSTNTKQIPDGGIEESFEWTYENGTQILTITHYNAVFNCCPAGIRSWAEIHTEAGQIELWEEEYTDDVFNGLCACSCPYNVTTPIPNVAPGTYDLTVYTDNQVSYNETINAQ